MIFEDRILKNPRLLRLKDPRTNEIVDFEIQDLLPEEIIQEGTEVGAEELNGQIVNEHSESTSNVYSASYVNGIADYSTTEKVCGTWIDGKPLYRKVLVTTWGDREASSQNISVSDLNIDTMVSITGKASYSNGWHVLGGYANANFYSLIQYNYREYNIQCYGKGYANANLVIILEYTKTTD